MAQALPDHQQMQPDHKPPLQRFRFWVDEKKVKGTCGPLTEVEHYFVPDELIYEYFEDDRRILQILEALGVGHAELAHRKTIQLRYRKVFCILLYIGKGEFIINFVGHAALDDEKLPFETEPQQFPKSADSLFNSFYKAQWIFHAAAFNFCRIDMRLGANSILPIIKKENIEDANGFSADLRKIVLHAAHHQLPASRESNISEEQASTFALKTYRSPHAARFYEIESNAFKRLFFGPNQPEGLIGFYGSFIHGDTYNILLEYADRGTLEKYFQNVTPPWSSDSIADFWDGLFGLVRALLIIHGELQRDPDSLQFLRGWHQDIKPENIFVLSGNTDSDYACRFKLGDLGQSHFKIMDSANAKASDRDSQGTRTYGAPECYRGDRFTHSIPLSVQPGVDIWSFGSICSEAAVWLLRGQDGLKKYRDLRQQCLHSIPGFRDHDCFHDGLKVLDCVTQTLEDLRQNLRMGDRVTEGMLDLMLDMLSPENARPSALQVWERSQRILKRRGSAMLSRTRSVHGSSLPMPGPQTPRHGSLSANSGFSPMSPNQIPTTDHQYDHFFGHSSQRSTSSNLMTSPLSPTPPLKLGDEGIFQPPSPISSHRSHCPQPLDSRLSALNIAIPEHQSLLENEGRLQESTKNSSSAYAHKISRNAISAPAVPQTTPHKRLPILTVMAGISWMHDQRRDMWSRLKLRKNLPGGRRDLVKQLDDRDHVFLIDDSASMEKHHDEAALLLELLATIVKDSDDDGIDLHFTGSDSPVHSKRIRNLIEAFKGRRFGGQPDVSKAMKKIFDDFLARRRGEIPRSWLRSKHSSPTPMTCYFLTDGEWPFSQNVENELQRFVNELSQSGWGKKDGFGFQLISFGKDEDKIAMFQRLDSAFDPDIVDTEPSNGNVWKMLLGSINPYWDDDTGNGHSESSTSRNGNEAMNGSVSTPRPGPYTFNSS